MTNLRTAHLPIVYTVPSKRTTKTSSFYLVQEIIYLVLSCV